MFLDDTACNLASLNLIQFLDPETKTFDVEAYEHAVRLWTLTLEISVAMAQFPSREIARLSYDYRTLGLGYANIGGLLMSSGIPYDSDAGRAICGALTAILTGRAYATSAEMAAKSGAFPGHKANAEAMLRVIRNHKRAADGEAAGYEQLSVAPTPLDHDELAKAGPAWAELGRRARRMARCAGARPERTAIATRRSPSSPRPARSASSWIATRPASSPTSRWSSSRSSPAAAISRSSTAPCPTRCARSATTRSRSTT